MSARVTVNINLALADRISGEAAERGVRAATIEAKNLTIDMLSQPGRGITYTHYFFTYKGRVIRGDKRETPHTASRPGDPPAPDTGRLRGSTQSEVFRTSYGAVGEVSVNTEYAAALELGTEKMAARPFISRVATQYAGRIQAVFARFARLP